MRYDHPIGLLAVKERLHSGRREGADPEITNPRASECVPHRCPGLVHRTAACLWVSPTRSIHADTARPFPRRGTCTTFPAYPHAGVFKLPLRSSNSHSCPGLTRIGTSVKSCGSTSRPFLMFLISCPTCTSLNWGCWASRVIRKHKRMS
jgi:hypothetical protein